MLTHPRICTIRFLSLVTTIVSALASASSAHAQQAFFTGLGDLPGGDFRSQATDVSADGTIVVGFSRAGVGFGSEEGFRWTRDTGMVSLGTRKVGLGRVNISADGATIATPNYRWTQSTGLETLPTLSGLATAALDISDDGKTIVGFASEFIRSIGVRWTANGVDDLSTIIGVRNSRVFAVAADGSRFGGYDTDALTGFVWNQDTGIRFLSVQNDPRFLALPIAFSADGSVVVGYDYYGSGGGPFRWSEQTGVVHLNWSTAEPFTGATNDVSADGSVIVGGRGDSGTGFTDGAWIWDSVHGGRDLKAVLTSEYGLGPSLAGWELLETAQGVSADGRTIVGYGYGPRGREAWIAHLGAPVPEPSALLLAALALVPLSWRRRGVQNLAGVGSTRVRFASLLIALAALLAAEPTLAQQPIRLTPADAATTPDFQFGVSVALSGDLALVGNDLSGLSNPPPGSAYVFDVTTGQQLKKLTPNDSAGSDYFGWSVALNGNLALIGAPNANNLGAAYLFDATTGQQLYKLEPSAFRPVPSPAFGNSVALSGTTALVGAPGEGATYLFDVTTGQQLRKFDAPSSTVALSGNKALIAAPFASNASVYDIISGELLISFPIPYSDNNHGSVGFWGDIALFSAVRDDHAGVNSGAAVLFDVTTGQQLFKLTASEPAEQDYFGSSVALNGNLALVASQFDDGVHDFSGSAYLFDVSTGQQLARLTSPDDGTGSRFAQSVALNGNTALIGGQFLSSPVRVNGAAYLFDVSVPEPSTLLLAAMTVLLLTWRRRGMQVLAGVGSTRVRFASLVIAAVAALASANSVHAEQAFFMGLGYLPGFDSYSRADDISGDGSIVVGNSFSSTNQAELFRWTRATGMVGLGTISYANAMEISDDGSTIALEQHLSNDPSYFRWRESTGIVPLPSAFSNGLVGISADGSKIALQSEVWREAGGVVSSPNNMAIKDISGDGLSLLGYQGGESGHIWSDQEGITILGPTLPDGTIFYNPGEISADGKVVVGFATRPNPSQSRLVLWKKETGMIDLGQASAGSTFSISEDGSVFTLNSSAFGDSAIWRESRGLEPLVAVLANEFNLASQMAGWSATSITPNGISNDGRTIVGRGTNPAGKTEAWIAYLGTPVPEPNTLLLAAMALVPLPWRRRAVRIHANKRQREWC